MKYVYLLIAMILMGCSDKSIKVEVPVQTKVEVVEVATVVEVAKVQIKPKARLKLKANETIIEEPMVTKRIPRDVPSSCAMWSDGCNVCTRKGGGKSICTTNPECIHKMFSCLQWQ